MLGDWAGGRILLHPRYAARRDDLSVHWADDGVWIMTCV